MSARHARLVIATEPEALIAGLAMLDAGAAWAVVYLEDATNRPGQTTARTWLGAGHEHRGPELTALIARAAEADGSVIVDGARVGKRGAA